MLFCLETYSICFSPKIFSKISKVIRLGFWEKILNSIDFCPLFSIIVSGNVEFFGTIYDGIGDKLHRPLISLKPISLNPTPYTTNFGLFEIKLSSFPNVGVILLFMGLSTDMLNPKSLNVFCT